MQVQGHKSSPLPGPGWVNFLQKTALTQACLLLASAGLCWIAANWEHASNVQKLAGVQLIVIALALAAWRLVYVSGVSKQHNLSISANLAALAAVATGALLALVGQIYQTGADTWQLFILWAVLLLPWLLAVRSVFIALLCALLLNTGGALYWSIFGDMLWGDLVSPWVVGSVLLSLLNAGLLLVWELSIHALADRWRVGPRILAIVSIGWLVAAAFAALDSSARSAVVSLSGLAALGLMYWVYTRLRHDLAMIGVAALGAFFLVGIPLGSLVESAGGLSLLIIILIAASAFGLNRLVKLVRAKRLVEDKIPAVLDRALPDPWFVSVFRFVVMGTTAILLIALLFITFDLEFEQIWWVGTGAAFGGLLIVRADRGSFVREFGLTLMTAGLLMAGGGLFAMDEVAPVLRAAAILLMGITLYVLTSVFAFRLLCGFFVLGLVSLLGWPERELYEVLDITANHAVWTYFPAYQRVWWFAVGAVLALTFSRQPRHAAFWHPLAWALVFLAQLSAWLAPAPAIYGLKTVLAHSPSLLVLWLACALLPVVVLATLLSRSPTMPARLRWAAPLGLAIASIGWMGAPGVAVSLLWLLLGYAMAQRPLLIFGVFAMLAYLAQFYYQLESSLLQKAGMLALTGAWLMSCYLGLRRYVAAKTVVASPAATSVGQAGVLLTPPSKPLLGHRLGRLAVLAGLPIGLALILVVVNASIYQREQILNDGQRVVVALAPVDPRSLMQGDYMALRFELANQVNEALQSAPEALASQIRDQGHGYMVLRPDPQGIFKLSSITAALPSAVVADAVPLEFRLRNHDVRIVSDAWFFPEGQAKRYEHARFGEFRVNSAGTGLLSGMLDEQLRPLP